MKRGRVAGGDGLRRTSFVLQGGEDHALPGDQSTVKPQLDTQGGLLTAERAIASKP